MTKIYFINTASDEVGDAYSRILPSLGRARREKTEKLASPDDRLRSLGAGILFEVMLADSGFGGAGYDHAADGDAGESVVSGAEVYMIRPRGLNAMSGLDYDTDAHGGPYLKALPYHFSLSHSGDYAMCAVSDRLIGCDIERMGGVKMRVAERYFHPSEVKLIEESPDAEREFYRIWTLREAVSKLDGRGIQSFTEVRGTDFSIESSEYMTYAGRVRAEVLTLRGHIAAAVEGTDR